MSTEGSKQSDHTDIELDGKPLQTASSTTAYACTIKALNALVNDGKAPSGVTEESVEAIDRVRSIGNIGAHMEKDIDLIVDVDPDDAQVLIDLVEMLFEEWYIARHKRQQRLDRIREIAETKQEERKGLPPAQPLQDGDDGVGGSDK